MALAQRMDEVSLIILHNFLWSTNVIKVLVFMLQRLFPTALKQIYLFIFSVNINELCSICLLVIPTAVTPAPDPHSRLCHILFDYLSKFNEFQ